MSSEYGICVLTLHILIPTLGRGVAHCNSDSQILEN